MCGGQEHQLGQTGCASVLHAGQVVPESVPRLSIRAGDASEQLSTRNVVCLGHDQRAHPRGGVSKPLCSTSLEHMNSTDTTASLRQVHEDDRAPPSHAAHHHVARRSILSSLASAVRTVEWRVPQAAAERSSNSVLILLGGESSPPDPQNCSGGLPLPTASWQVSECPSEDPVVPSCQSVSLPSNSLVASQELEENSRDVSI